jgi:hypothetical protein
VGGGWVAFSQWCHVHWISSGAPDAARAERVHVFSGPLRQNTELRIPHIMMRNRIGHSVRHGKW